MWAAAWTTVLGFGILALLVYFVSNKWYPIPYEWRRLITLSAASALTLGAAWAIGWSLGVSVYQPFGSLVAGQLAMTPALLVFPLVLWAARFFTPEERRIIGRLGRRVTRRRAAAPVAAAVPAAALAGAGLPVTGTAPSDLTYEDRTAEDELTPDEVEAELEETEIEAEVDIAEGGSTQL